MDKRDDRLDAYRLMLSRLQNFIDNPVQGIKRRTSTLSILDESIAHFLNEQHKAKLN